MVLLSHERRDLDDGVLTVAGDLLGGRWVVIVVVVLVGLGGMQGGVVDLLLICDIRL